MVDVRVLFPDDWQIWREVRLAVADGNQAAASLYERHGFSYAGEAGLMPDGVRREFMLERPCRRDAAAG